VSALVDRAHRTLMESMAVFADRSVAGFSEIVGGTMVVVSGLPYAAFNQVAVTGSAEDEELRRAMDIAASSGYPWCVMLREEFDDRYLGVVHAAGLTKDSNTVPLMAATSPRPAPWPDELALATGSWTVAMHRALLTAGFEMDMATVKALVTDEVAQQPGVEIVVGTHEGLPVTTAMSVRRGDTVSIFNVTTTAEVRRRGYGSAVTWAAMEPSFASGATLATLQTSDLGRGVYEGLGYEVVAMHQRWMPAEDPGH